MEENPVRFWDEAAARFDQEPDHGLRDPAVRAAWRELLLPLMPRPPARIADIGSGTGTLSLLLAEAGHQVSGIDLSPRMVAAAKAKALDAAVPVDFHTADAAAAPWPAHTFDVVLARHVAWTLPDLDAALRHWVELLKPTGHLILIEGRWSTGAGLSPEDLTTAILRHRHNATITNLTDPRLWGRPTHDHRYLLLSRQ